MNKDKVGLIFLSLTVVIIFLISSLNFFRYFYTEEFSINYLSSRLTLLIPNDNYLEIYRANDNIIFEQRGFFPLLNETNPVLVNIEKHKVFGNNESIYEEAENDNAKIISVFTKNSSNDFRLERNISIDEDIVSSGQGELRMLLVLGPDQFEFDEFQKILTSSDCSIEITNDKNYIFTFEEDDNILIISQRIIEETTNYTFGFNLATSCEDE